MNLKTKRNSPNTFQFLTKIDLNRSKFRQLLILNIPDKRPNLGNVEAWQCSHHYPL